MAAIPRPFTILGQGQGGTYLFADGTAAAPSISFINDTDTGWYRSASNRMSLALGGSGILHFATNGVIANAISGASLTLSDSTGAVTVAAAGTNQNITLTPSGVGFVSALTGGGYSLKTGATGAVFSVYTTGSTVQIGTESASQLDFFTTAGAAQMSLRTNGRFLLGTTTDSGALLQVGTNTTTSAGGMVFGTDWFLYRTAAGAARVESTSNYGLEVKNSAGTGAASLGFTNTGGAMFVGNDNSTGSALGSSSAYAGVITTTTAVPLIFRTNSTTALTIDSSQNATFAGTVIYFGGATSSNPRFGRSGDTVLVKLGDDSAFAPMFMAQAKFSGNPGAITTPAGHVTIGGTTSTTVGAAGGASALPATPTGYISANVAGTVMKVPYYAS